MERAALFLQDKTYGLYILYLASVLLYFGFINDLIWFWNIETPTNLILIAINTTYIFAALFSREFLNTRKNTPVLDQLILAIPVFALINLAVLLRDSLLCNQLSYMLSLYSALIFIAAGIKRSYQNFRPAYYYSLAWIILSLSIIVFALRGIGLLPNHFMVKYSSFLGITAKTMLLSLALVNRVRVLRAENQVLALRSRTDELTGLFNKRYFSEKLSQYICSGNQRGRKSGLIMIDVDTPDQILDRADEAFYKAKRMGRNQTATS